MNWLKSFLLIVFTTAFSLHVLAETYYLRTDGRNANPGTENTPEGAWQNLSFAWKKLQSGDSLLVNDGIYMVSNLRMYNIRGTEEKPVYIGAINKWGVKITMQNPGSKWDNLWQIAYCHHLIIDGFEVYSNSTINRREGIGIRENSKYITIKNCYVHDCGCNGIGMRHSDYVTIEKNVVRDNAKISDYNCSGISIWEAKQYDDKEGYHIIVRQNIAFENECRLPFTPAGFDVPTDGNGIIIDYLHETGYKADILVENNLSFNNGGRGIHVFRSDNVTVQNNTVWHNMYVLHEYDQYKADLEFYESKGSGVFNNIAIQNENQPTQALRMYAADGINTKVYNNLVVGVKDFWPQKPEEKNNQIKSKTMQDYPQLKNPTTEIDTVVFEDIVNHFGLQKTSPAVNAAHTEIYSPVDISGRERPIGNAPDMGCYELDKISSNPVFEKNSSKFTVYPNPATGAIVIEGDQQFNIKIMDTSGRVLFEKPNCFNRLTVDVSKFAPGLYMVRAGSKSNYTMLKFLKR